MDDQNIPAEKKVLASDLVHYTDEQLQRFLKNSRPDRDSVIPVDWDSWMALPKATARHLVERFDQVLAQKPHLDCDELIARLQNIPTDSDGCAIRTTPEPPDVPMTPLRTPFYKENEHIDYQALLADGGRPFYPIEKLDAVAKVADDDCQRLIDAWSHLDPFSFYIDMARCFIFRRQLDRWEEFRRCQLEYRNQETHAYDKFMHSLRTFYERWADRYSLFALRLRELKNGEGEDWHEPFEHWDIYREREIKFFGQGGKVYNGFSDYAEGVRSCLRQHGFMGCVDLNVDCKKQDDLATWAEYVHFEFWWIEAYERALERATLIMKTEWEKYHDQGIFTKDETLTVVLSDEFYIKVGQETTQLYQTWREHDLAGISPTGRTKPRPPGTTEEMGIQLSEKCREMSRKFDAVRAVLRVADYINLKKFLRQHKTLFKWVLDQLHQIEEGIGPLTYTISAGAGETGREFTGSGQAYESKMETLRDLEPTGVTQRRDLTPASPPGEQANSPERQGKSPISPRNSGRSSKPQGSSDEPNDVAGTGSIVCQGASTSQGARDATNASMTMEGEGVSTDRDARGLSLRESPDPAIREVQTGEGEGDQGSGGLDPGKMLQQGGAREEGKAQKPAQAPATKRRKRKRELTAEEIDASINRKKSLRPGLNRPNYKV